MILFKKLLRTLGKYKAQFISMIIMIALGAGVFLGFNIEWYSIDRNTKKYFENSNYANFRVYSQQGFSSEDIDTIKQIDGVDEATRWLSIKVSVVGKDANLALNAVENYGISKFYLTSGENYNKNSNGVWLSDQFAKANNYHLGDEISLQYVGTPATLEIVGLIKSAEYMVCVDENQVMPKYKDYGFCFVTPTTIENIFGTAFFNQVSLNSNLQKEQLESEINQALNKTLLLLSLDENQSYLAAKGEAEEGQTMGAILPVLFLLIAVLTMITTMHRITKHEKTQIGTLKALGFKDKTILAHYTSFGLIIGAVGCLVGVLIGFGIAAIVINPKGMLSTYFDWPEWKLYTPWFCPIVLLLIVGLLTFISFITVKNILKGMPAETLRPYEPKQIKATKLEKTKMWKNFSFGFKWNYRDTIRNKTRSIVTLIGVIGCVILIVASLGMKDSMALFMQNLDKSMNYKNKINISETATTEQIEQVKNSYVSDSVAVKTIEFEKEAINLEIYNISHDYIKFFDKNNKELKLADDGVTICLRLADTGIKVGDIIKFTPYGSKVEYSVRVANINRSAINKSITMTETYANTLGIDFKTTALFTDADNINQTLTAISSVQDKDKLIESYTNFLQIMNTMIVILIVAALGLGIVVLYNLGVMSYTERFREFSTLKVVGFKDKQISKLLISQNVWLTVIGTLLGLPAGFGVLYWMVKALAGEYELKVLVHFSSYTIAVLLTFGVSILVGLLISKKNKHINMVDALKDKEC